MGRPSRWGRGPSWLAALAVASAVLSLVLVPVAPPARAQPVGSLETVLTGLSWPVALAFTPDGRVLFAERLSGNIRVIENGSLVSAPFYRLPNTATLTEQGLLGLAVHPSFATDPWVYAYQTFNDAANGTVYNRIVRILADGNTGTSLEVVLDRIPAAAIHNGGVIAFGPDGMLYAVVGEAGVPAAAQDLGSRSGKVLRMRPDGSVPPDNPFLSDATADPYVFTYGHRNMFGLAFHPMTGRAFVSENGPQCNDEVNLLASGRNFGWGPNWSCSEPPPSPANTNQDGPSPVLPIHWFETVTAPTNLAAYGGPAFGVWQGDLFLGEWNTGQVRRLDLRPPGYDAVLGEEVIVRLSFVLDVEAGPDGAIWITTSTAIYRYVDVSQPPTASFSFSPPSPLVGERVDFDAGASSDPDGVIVGYAWAFGDGTTASGATASHAFATHGSFDVRLTVTDSQGLTNSTTRRLRVLAPPQASFTFSPTTPRIGEALQVDASGSSDPDGSIATYAWDWGDGTSTVPSASPTASHAYAAYGAHAILLEVTDGDGLMAVASRTVRVLSPPVADFVWSPSNPRPGEAVAFDAAASSDPDGTVAAYAWDFGDGAFAIGRTTAHAYLASGTYLVALTVTDNDTLSSTVIRSVRVNMPPVASFSADPPGGFVGEVIQFDGRASADGDGTIASFAWDFGDGATASGPEVTHAYASRGTFRVTLVVTDDAGATNATSAVIAIGNRAPVIETASPADDVRVVSGATATFSVGVADPDGDDVLMSWWVNGVAQAGTGPSFTFQASAPGLYVVRVTASDGAATVSREWNVTVDAAVPDPLLVLVVPGAATVAVIVAGALYVALRMRRRSGETKP